MRTLFILTDSGDKVMYYSEYNDEKSLRPQVGTDNLFGRHQPRA